jgi:hypothetical protein
MRKQPICKLYRSAFAKTQAILPIFKVVWITMICVIYAYFAVGVLMISQAINREFSIKRELRATALPIAIVFNNIRNFALFDNSSANIASKKTNFTI